MVEASQATKDHKAKYRAIILGLFPQFSENETLLHDCTSRDSLSHVSQLCTTIQQRNVEHTSEDRWSHVLNSINEALVRRLRAKGTANTLSPSVYGLKSEDFRDAQIAAKLRPVNLANLFVIARELDMAENPDGIMTRRNATLPPKKIQSVRSLDATSLRSSTTSQRIPTHAAEHRAPAPQSSNNQQPRPPAAPSGPVAARERRIHKTYFDDHRHSDLTIVLGDVPVHVHCVVLCRASEYFDLLLETNTWVC